MKRYIYLTSFFAMMLVFLAVSLFVYFKVSDSKYEELLKREASGLSDSRQVSIAVRVKPDQSKKELENILQYTFANELMDQIRKKQTLREIVVRAYTSTIDFQKNPDITWEARLEKIGDEDEKILFPNQGKSGVGN